MTKERTQEAIKVMQAWVDGKEVEYRPEGMVMWKTFPFAEHLAFNFQTCEYRIKPEPGYRPFESVEEVMEAIKEHGDWVKNKFTERYVKLLEISANTIWAGCYATKETMQGYLYDEAFASYTFADGTPFGKLMEG